MLVAYFDESERTGGVFCVAGYAFAPPQARKFKKEWLQLFRLTGGCHMVDLVARRRAFTGISEAERDRLLREAVQIINKRMSFGVAFSCDVAEVQALTPRWIRGFGHAYPICCYMSMVSLGRKLEQENLSEQIKYIFESGHEFEAEARDFIEGVTKLDMAKDACCFEEGIFLPKSDAVPLQAADLLAWEYAKFRDETLERHLRPIRKSLEALFEGRIDRYCGYHVTGPSLARFFQKVRNLGLLELQERRLKKVAHEQSRYA